MKKKQAKNKTHTKKAAPQTPSDFSEMKEELKKRGWGKDILTNTIEMAFCNVGVTFLKLKPYFELLIKANEIFNDVYVLLSTPNLEKELAALLFGRANGCFIGAVRLSCSAQITETWALLRACLENSLYAFYIAENSEYANVWINRHKSDVQREECKRVFLIRNMWEKLDAKSKTITKEAKKLYEQSIDFGAHPNERSLFVNLQNGQNGSGLSLKILNPDESFMRAILCYILSTASTVFKIFSLIFTEEFNQPKITIKINNLHENMRPLLFSVSYRLKNRINKNKG